MIKGYDWRPIERERVLALMSHNSGEYARLCYELGIEPEDQELYNQGAQPEFDLSGLEKVVDEELKELKPLKKRKRSVSNATYGRFYDEGLGLSENIFRDSEAKRGLLLSYFPMRFGSDGRLPVYDAKPGKVGSLFNSLMIEAKRRSEE